MAIVASNNSVLANSGDDLSSIIDKIAINGEPGILWVDLMRKYETDYEVRRRSFNAQA